MTLLDFSQRLDAILAAAEMIDARTLARLEMLNADAYEAAHDESVKMYQDGKLEQPGTIELPDNDLPF